eukprot:TRINITY_DN4031_c0_g1_i1.p1 TRINITY_DN4031_c0_g1~~TRINITY_DN4031_c0_g1_i1.p1  ORF type:complete len:55 (+),score=3.30 TRINITY_DN4031_c0_g1_i1:69-233(+)
MFLGVPNVTWCSLKSTNIKERQGALRNIKEVKEHEQISTNIKEHGGAVRNIKQH